MKRNLVLLLGLIVFAGLGSAMLISYISNSVTADVSVESPLVMNIVGGTDNALVLSGVYGGDSVSFQTLTDNMASVDIVGNYEIIVSNNLDNVTCEDFTTATFNSVDMTCVDGIETATFTGSKTYTSGVVDESDSVVFTFALNIAPADYTIQSQIEMA